MTSRLRARGDGRRVYVAVLSALLLGAAACSSAPSVTAPAAATPAGGPTGQLVVAQGTDADTLDPYMTSSSAVWSITLNLYDTLQTRDKDGKLQPGLATSVTNVDPLTWELKLRPNVTFQNGEPFDATAVKFSIERMLDPSLGSVLTSTVNTIDHVDIVDPLTVRVVTKAPDPILPSRLSLQAGQILPPKYAAQAGKDGLAQSPIGAGPYRFVKWDKDDQIVLEAVPDNWRKPKIKTIVFKPIPEGSTRVAALKTGQVDIAAAIPPADFNGIANADKTFGINVMSNRSFLLNMDTLNFEPFKDKRVRQAMNYAVDKDAIVKNTLGGYGKPIGCSVIPEAFGYDASACQRYPYDPAKAKQLLAEAGFASGFDVGFDSTDGRYPQDKEIATAIAGQLAQVGVRANVQTFEWGSFYQGVQARKRAPIHDIGMSTEQFDADNTMSIHFASSGAIWSRWLNPQFDQLFNQERTTVDPRARQQLLAQADQIQHDEAPMVYLHQIAYLYGVNKRVKNWQPNSTEPILVWDASVD